MESLSARLKMINDYKFPCIQNNASWGTRKFTIESIGLEELRLIKKDKLTF